MTLRLKDKRTGEIVTFANIGLNNDVDRSDGTDEDVFFALKEDRFYSLAELNEKYEDATEEKKYGGRVPKDRDKYYYINACGDVCGDIWESVKSDIGCFESGSAFWTEEEAEKELARRKAYVILKEDTKGFKPNWDDGREEKFTVYYSHQTGEKDFRVQIFWGIQHVPDLVFANLVDAKASIKAHEKEWKAWLGVEDE